MKEHLTAECYLVYNPSFISDSLLNEIEELCQQIWAEIKINKTWTVKEFKSLTQTLI